MKKRRDTRTWGFLASVYGPLRYTVVSLYVVYPFYY